MMKIVKYLLLLSLTAVLAGCKIAVLVVEGGKVQSAHNSDCFAGTICLVEVTDTNFSETFTAVPDPGWEFTKWNKGDGFFCANSKNPTCNLSNVGTAGIAIIEAIISSENTFYLMPVFTKGVPITETVIVGDKEWAQVDLFLGIDWNQINAVCPNGVCSGAIHGYSLIGWTWASNVDVGNLFIQFGAPVDVLSSVESREIDSAWAPAIYGAFRTSNSNGSQILSGISKTLITGDNTIHRAPLVYDLAPGLEDVASINNPDANSVPLPYKGAWFFRSL